MIANDRTSTIPGSLAQQAAVLWRRQITEWGMLNAGLTALRQARTRSFDVRGSRVLVQYNPARTQSTAARIDEASLAARPCFLCDPNRPPQQRAILYRDEWLILCNPAPIFDPHFTIVKATHEPQRILPYVELMLNLTRDLDGRYSLFYNGPLCGASAPDHVHLQATPAGVTPFETELAAELCTDRNHNGQRWIEWVRRDPVRLGVTRPSRRPAVLFVGQSAGPLAESVRDAIQVLGAVHPAEPEPMLNLFATFSEERWLLWLYPRKAHRPTIYGEGPDNYLISPGAIDLAGVVITPRQADFERLEADTIELIFEQVLLSPGTFAQFRDRLAAR